MVNNFLNFELLNNRIIDYLIWLGVLSIGLILIYIVKNVVIRQLESWAKKTTTKIDDFIISQVQKNFVPLLYWWALIISTKYLSFPEALAKGLNVLGVILLVVFASRFFLALVDYLIESQLESRKNIGKSINGIRALKTAAKVVLIGLAVFVLLDNLGIRVSTLIAGLGIGGIAVALAAQTMLGDVFSFAVILIDRPFEIGDFIVVDDYMGTIETIGLKTTRIRSISGEQLIFPNAVLTSSKVRNYKRMQQRRAVLKLGVTYDTTKRKLEEAVEIVKKAIQNTEGALFERSHFSSFGDFSLNLEAVYHVLSEDYAVYMDIQQKINFAVMDEFNKSGISFAFPTQTLYVNKA